MSDPNFNEFWEREQEEAYRALVEADVEALEDELESRWERLNRDQPMKKDKR